MVHFRRHVVRRSGVCRCAGAAQSLSRGKRPAIGAWIGPSQLVVALVITGIAGGIMAICWAVAGGFLGDLFTNTGSLIFGVKERGLRPHPELVLENPAARKMPYAPAIAIGTLISFFSH